MCHGMIYLYPVRCTQAQVELAFRAAMNNWGHQCAAVLLGRPRDEGNSKHLEA